MFNHFRSWNATRIYDFPLPHDVRKFYHLIDLSFQVIAETVKRMNWHSYTFVYQTTDALTRVQEALQIQGALNCPITVRELQPFNTIRLLKTKKEQDNIYESLVKEIRLSSQYSLLLDIENDNIPRLFEIMRQMELMSDYFMCFLTNLVSTRFLN